MIHYHHSMERNTFIPYTYYLAAKLQMTRSAIQSDAEIYLQK